MTANLQPTLADYEECARNILSPENEAYFFGGAGAEQTLNSNLHAFKNTQLIPRHLRDVSGGSTKLELLGQTLQHPIIVAPVAYQKLVHGDGEIATALGTAAQETQMVLSAQSSVLAEDAIESGETCNWFQLYWMVTREATLSLINRVHDAGYRAIVLTIDAPVQGVRDEEIRSGFHLPADIRAVNLEQMPQPHFESLQAGESMIFDRIANISPSWEDVAWLCAQAPLPVILKGIMHADDGQQAVKAGAAGIIVSNHGGRILDTVPATLEVLPQIIDAVGNDVPVLMDGGIRRGIDVIKALALGAKAVLVGRPIISGLTVAGAEGVSHVLRLLRDELEISMMLTGCRTLEDIGPDIIYRNE